MIFQTVIDGTLQEQVAGAFGLWLSPESAATIAVAMDPLASEGINHERSEPDR
jgi:hypothetical protein